MRNLYGRHSIRVMIVLTMIVASIVVPQFVQANTIGCEKQATLINYRSKLLTAYKKKHDRTHNATRELWAGRISYASQWLTTDAEAARDNLYRFDALHAATNTELDSQIAAYRRYQADPLLCSKDKAAIERAYKVVQGDADKKHPTGDARIKTYRAAENQFEQGTFNKTNTKLIRALHVAKKKHSAPLYPRLIIAEN